jgi:NADH-quinone oxidoreductase subunit L
MRTTFATFAIGMMALAGVPFLFSGFWSKEAILHAAHAWPVSQLPLVVALVAVVLTAFYMTRLVAEAFFGKPRSAAAEHAHESPAVMTVPLVLLAICSIGVGFLGTPAWPWLQSMLTGEPVHPHGLFEGAGLMVLSILLVATGIGAGWALYGRRLRSSASSRDPLDARVPGVIRALGARLYFDEFYAATAGRLNRAGAALADGLDRFVWGGIVSFLGGFGLFAGLVSRQGDEDGLNGGFDAGSAGVRRAGQAYSRRQNGDVHGYLRAIAIGFVILLLVLSAGGVR